jgi:hypothetical protein
MKRMVIVISLFLLGLLSASARADVTWPASDNLWNPVLVGGSPYVDAQADSGFDSYDTKPPKPMDIVGGTDPQGDGPFAAGFWSVDATNIMFRMRVDGDPSQAGQFVWTVLLNTDADSDVDWALQLDMSGDEQVELVQALSGGPDNGWDVTLAGPPHTIAYDETLYSRFSNASSPLDPPFTGSHFHGPEPIDDDYFVDIAMPLADFIARTGWHLGEPLGIAFSTSASHIVDNKDRPDYAGWAVPPIPAPGAALLATLGAAAVGYLRTRRML